MDDVLGIAYATSAVLFLVWAWMKNNASQLELVFMVPYRRYYVVFFYLLSVICTTVAYQWYFGDFTTILTSWRLGLNLIMQAFALRVIYTHWKIRKIIENV